LKTPKTNTPIDFPALSRDEVVPDLPIGVAQLMKIAKEKKKERKQMVSSMMCRLL
jgi:hypothetical protein